MPAYAADTLDLSRISVDDIIPALSYTDALAAFVEAFLKYWGELRAADPTLPQFDVEGLKTDPAIVIGQAGSYLRDLERAAFDDRVRELLLVSARGKALDLIGSTYYGVFRMITPANAATGAEEVQESDDRFRLRLQLAPEAGLPRAIARGARLGAAKTLGGYRFHALSCDLRVKDADAASLARGDVTVSVLAEDGQDPDVVAASVRSWLMRDGVKGATDILTVKKADILVVNTKATLLALNGPDASVLIRAASASLSSFAAARGPFRAPLYLNAIDAALQVAGIETLIRTAPLADVLPAFGTVIRLGSIELAVQRVGPAYG